MEPYLLVRNQAQQKLVRLVRRARTHLQEAGTPSVSRLREISLVYAILAEVSRNGATLPFHTLQEYANEVRAAGCHEELPFLDYSEAFGRTRVDRTDCCGGGAGTGTGGAIFSEIIVSASRTLETRQRVSYVTYPPFFVLPDGKTAYQSEDYEVTTGGHIQINDPAFVVGSRVTVQYLSGTLPLRGGSSGTGYGDIDGGYPESVYTQQQVIDAGQL